MDENDVACQCVCRIGPSNRTSARGMTHPSSLVATVTLGRMLFFITSTHCAHPPRAFVSSSRLPRSARKRVVLRSRSILLTSALPFIRCVDCRILP
eukprot:1998621-Pleurochrysis_carterae.AAC.2